MRRVHFDVTDSTNLQARQLWEEQAAGEFAGAYWTPDSVDLIPIEPLLITAAQQSAGRGRRGRAWCSPRGGAWMSLVWPMRRAAGDYAAVSLAAAVGVRRGLVEVIDGLRNDEPPAASCQPPAVLIKWPNDLLIEGRKVGGILCEQFVMSRGEARAHSPIGSPLNEGVLVVGVGVNVDFDLALLGAPDDLRHPATTLAAALGRKVEVESVIEAVSRRLAEALGEFERDGFGGVLEELRGSLAYVGTVRRFSSPRGEVAGRVVGVDGSGRLMLETDQGKKVCEVGELLE
jgi:BirA family biotin operon repressor/biotin-[acetyl-CoA-carboxylase] ligase